MNFSSGFGLKASFTGLRKFNFCIKRIKFIRDRTILFSVRVILTNSITKKQYLPDDVNKQWK